jgi:PilZ domain
MFEEHRKPGGNGFRPMPIEERRTYPRYHFTAAVEALDQNHRTRMNARTSDIGRGGCYVDTYCPFPLKTGVKLRLTNEKSSFVAEAKVVNSKIGMGMGLEFVSVEPQQMQVLDKWIGELSGSAPMQFAGLEEHHNSNGHTNAAPHKETGFVLNELIIALMRKGALTEEEGKTMLLRLLHHDFLP